MKVHGLVFRFDVRLDIPSVSGKGELPPGEQVGRGTGMELETMPSWVRRSAAWPMSVSVGFEVP